ncbi:DUF3991 and TOPRIM domain-containing protein [Methylocapsa aurea]|uniref:DUF3991 and TOPRIM domain-containing protein n=1 Tax=Methylocapsa aurea TaxID=663610 RepID=UPI0009FCB3DE|nr:DUF3991 and TOPRIM domain-containing protein [Methylocapsa aurea]
MQHDRLAVGQWHRGKNTEEEKDPAVLPANSEQERRKLTKHDPEIEKLREEVNCAALLERLPPPWRLDWPESTKNCLKCRRGAGEIIIVNHEGRGWWDPGSEAKGDVFDLVQHFDPSLNFGQARKLLREFIGLRPTFAEDNHPRRKTAQTSPIAARWRRRPRLRRGSPAWRYLNLDRRLPARMLEAAIGADVVREGPYASAWFAHRDDAGSVTHVEIRGPGYKGSLTGGAKTLFRFTGASPPFSRLVVTEAPIDAMSLAAFENFSPGTLYAATGGGMGPATIGAIERLLAGMAGMANSAFFSATDANPAGDRYAAQHKAIAAKAGVAFSRLRPPIESGDWNDVLKQQTQQSTAP